MGIRYPILKNDSNHVPDFRADSIADLRAVPDPGIDSGSVTIKYHSLPGDGGGGLFYWHADEDTADDDGMYILPDGHTGDGRWVRDGHLGVVNVQWYGAAKDTNVDVSAQFQAAIDAATDLYVPPNPINSSYRVYNLGLKSDLRIHFSHKTQMHSIFTAGDWQTCFVTGTEGLFNVHLEGGEFVNFNSVWTHDNGTVAANGLADSSCSDMAVFAPITGSGLSPSFKFTRILGFVFDQVSIFGGKYGIHFAMIESRPHYITTVAIQNCSMSAITDSCIFSEDTTKERSGITISNCLFDFNESSAIVLGGNLSGCLIKGSNFSNNSIVTGDPDIIISGVSTSVRSVTIEDNHIGLSSVGQTYRIRAVGLTPLYIAYNSCSIEETVKLLDFQGTSGFRNFPIIWLKGNFISGNIVDDHHDILYDYTGVDESSIVVEENSLSSQIGRDRNLYGRRTTSDATPLTVETIPTFIDRTIGIRVTAIARDNTAVESAMYEISALFDNASDVVTQKGPTTVLSSYEDDASWDVTFSVSGTDILMQLTGDSTNDVKWTWEGKVIYYG